ncbi:hypothetical protein GCM10023148_12630 [Actinokineospora soli]
MDLGLCRGMRPGQGLWGAERVSGYADLILARAGFEPRTERSGIQGAAHVDRRRDRARRVRGGRGSAGLGHHFWSPPKIRLSL